MTSSESLYLQGFAESQKKLRIFLRKAQHLFEKSSVSFWKKLSIFLGKAPDVFLKCSKMDLKTLFRKSKKCLVVV